MQKVKIYPAIQRTVLVFGGIIFFLIGFEGVIRAGVGGKIMYVLILAFAGWWCYRGARIGLTIDQFGVTERSLGVTRRISWGRIKEVVIGHQSGAGVIGASMIMLKLDDGGVIPLRATARLATKGVERIFDEIARIRASVQEC